MHTPSLPHLGAEPESQSAPPRAVSPLPLNSLTLPSLGCTPKSPERHPPFRNLMSPTALALPVLPPCTEGRAVHTEAASEHDELHPRAEREEEARAKAVERRKLCEVSLTKHTLHLEQAMANEREAIHAATEGLLARADQADEACSASIHPNALDCPAAVPSPSTLPSLASPVAKESMAGKLQVQHEMTNIRIEAENAVLQVHSELQQAVEDERAFCGALAGTLNRIGEEHERRVQVHQGVPHCTQQSSMLELPRIRG